MAQRLKVYFVISLLRDLLNITMTMFKVSSSVFGHEGVIETNPLVYRVQETIGDSLPFW